MVPSHADEVSRLSLSLLHLMREIARQNSSEAAMYFGVPEEIAHLVSECSVADLQALARPGVMFFVPRIKTQQFRQLIENPGAPLEQARAVAIALGR